MESPPIYVGPMPRMAREITIKAIEDLGYTVSDAPADPADLRPPAEGAPAPVLIVSSRACRLDEYARRLLAVVPQLGVIVIDQDGRRLARHELWPRRLALGELSVDAIAAAIRTATSWEQRFLSAHPDRTDQRL